MANSGITAATSPPPHPQSASAAQTRPTQVASPVGTAKPVETKSEIPTESLKPQRDPRSLQFQIQGTRIVTTIVDAKDHTVVEQIPDAEVLRLAEAIDRVKGFFFDEKA